ncbi:hypothetical protein AXG93_400s1080 [Marchantia polymorpha subsp. ruderalis]|uniref:Clusterin-associated protein 1 n=2 Tax=Marchantia polymorpha TaxID=3197 RepID=A0A176WQV2_MARPO|nr:hypothetical protein AXG93_400s1080 [Marchantia polymorpha subsp. ruderalis]
MKVLGYSHTISMDSFRKPNFELVADCLHWLMMRYDPTIDLDTDISVEARRVAFLKRATHLVLSGPRLKLNLRRLYSADGYAVKELLKVAQLLHNATMAATNNEKEGADFGPSLKPFDVKTTRLLVSDITRCGASLYAVLETEPALQEARSRATMVNTDMDEIERGLKEAITAMLESISASEQEQSSSEKDEKAMEAKVEKRKLELERSEKRLSTLHNVRPAYMDKYEALQKDLHDLFVTYSEKHRNLQWLQSQMEEHRLAEQEKLEDTDRRMRRLQRRLHEEELCILRGEEVNGSMVSAGSSEESDGEGTTFWKWFDGSSFKSILDPRAKVEARPANTNDRMIRKAPPEWIHHVKRLPETPRQVVSNTQSREVNSAKNRDQVKNGDDTKPGPPSTHQISPNESDISGDLEEGDDELLDMDGLDPKDTAEDDSTDDDF